MTSYFAHSVKGKEDKDWQDLKHHLLSVAALARGKAEKFGAGVMGEVAGLLHDVGKY